MDQELTDTEKQKISSTIFKATFGGLAVSTSLLAASGIASNFFGPAAIPAANALEFAGVIGATTTMAAVGGGMVAAAAVGFAVESYELLKKAFKAIKEHYQEFNSSETKELLVLKNKYANNPIELHDAIKSNLTMAHVNGDAKKIDLFTKIDFKLKDKDKIEVSGIPTI